MCRFLSKLLGSCCSLSTLHSLCLFIGLFGFYSFASAQIVAIEDPIGFVIPNDSTHNLDPTNDQDGTELSSLTSEELLLTITTQKISLDVGPDQLIRKIALFNTSGQLVFADAPNRPDYSSLFQRELSGVYILIVHSTQGVLHQKLFLQP